MFVKLDQNGMPTEWPVAVQRIRFEHKSVSFPRDMSNVDVRPYGFAPFEYSDPQEHDPQWQEAQELTPVEVNGVFVQQWQIVEKYTPEEKVALIAEQAAQAEINAAASVRIQRDSLLIDTDWVVIKAQETGGDIPADMATYRQALRDITTHANFPYLEEADWPVKP